MVIYYQNDAEIKLKSGSNCKEWYVCVYTPRLNTENIVATSVYMSLVEGGTIEYKTGFYTKYDADEYVHNKYGIGFNENNRIIIVWVYRYIPKCIKRLYVRFEVLKYLNNN